MMLEQIVYGSALGLAGDGVTDDAPAINAALADPDVREVRLGGGTFAVGSQISIPSNKILSGAGRDATIIRRIPIPAPETSTHSIINAANGTTNVIVRDLTADGNRSGQGMDAQSRCHGVVIGSINFLIERVYVENTTGYAFYNAAPDPGGEFQVSGIVRDCACWNFNVGFEATGDTAPGITYYDCHAHTEPRDEGDLVSHGTDACFHYYGGASNLTLIRCTADGIRSIAFNAFSNTGSMKDFTLIDCRFHMTGDGIAFLVDSANANYKLTNLVIVGCSFRAPETPSAYAAQFKHCEASISNTRFEGWGKAISVDAGASVRFEGCWAKGIENVSGTSYAYGIYVDGTGSALWNGGELIAHGAVGKELPYRPAGDLRTSHETRCKRITGGVTFFAPLTNLNNDIRFDFLPDNFADDTAAAAGGIAVKRVYRTGSTWKVRVT